MPEGYQKESHSEFGVIADSGVDLDSIHSTAKEPVLAPSHNDQSQVRVVQVAQERKGNVQYLSIDRKDLH